jgi:hypothetical protein
MAISAIMPLLRAQKEFRWKLTQSKTINILQKGTASTEQEKLEASQLAGLIFAK